MAEIVGIDREMRNFLRKYGSILAFTLVCLVVLQVTYAQRLVWFSDDTFFPLNLWYALYHYSFAWNYGPTGSQFLVPLLFLLDVVYKLVNSLVVVQMLLFLSLLVLSGVGVIALFRYITRSTSIIGEMILASMYTFNLYSISVIWNSFQVRSLFYALLPFMILLFLKSMEEPRWHLKAVYLLVLTLGMSLTGLYFVPPTILIFFAMSFLFYKRIRPRNQLITWLAFLSLLGVTNAYYLFSMASSLGSTLVAHLAAEPSTLFFAFPRAQNILNSLRLLAYEFVWYWGWGVPNYSWSTLVTSSPVFVLASLGPIIYSVFVLLTTLRRKSMLIISAVIILIIGVLVSSAGSPPFGSVIYWLLSALHLESVYDIPFQVFGSLIVISYSLFLIIGLKELAEEGSFTKPLRDSLLDKASDEGHRKERSRRLPFAKVKIKVLTIRGQELRVLNMKKVVGVVMITLLAVSVIFTSYPAWSGQIFSDGINRGPSETAVPSAFIEVPNDYSAFNYYAEGLDHNYSLLVLPPYSPSSHTWMPANETATDPLIEYYAGGLNVINLDTLTSSPMISMVNELIFANTNGQAFLAILAHMSVRYILLEKDWLDLVYYQQPLSFYSDYLNNVYQNAGGALTLIWNSSDLVLYEITCPTPSTIIQPVRYAYAIPDATAAELAEFYSFSKNLPYSVLTSSSIGNEPGIPLLYANSLTLNSSIMFLPGGNYSMFIEGEANTGNVNSQDIGVAYDNETTFMNASSTSQVEEVLNGSVPLVHLEFQQDGWHDLQILEPLMTADFTSLMNSSSSSGTNTGWSYDHLGQTISGSSAVDDFNVSLPNIMDVSFNVMITANPSQISYGGILFGSESDSSVPLGVFFRLGPENSSGGILITQQYPLDPLNIYYNNTQISQNLVYQVQLIVDGPTIEVLVNGSAISFLSHDSLVTNNGFTAVSVPDNFQSLQFVTLGLPMTISGFTITYHPISITNALVMEDPPSSDPVITGFSIAKENPSLFQISGLGSESNYLLLINGLITKDWVLTYETDPAGSILPVSSHSLSGNDTEMVHWGWVNGTLATIYLYYEPQSLANLGLWITLLGIILVSATALAIEIRRRSRLKKASSPKAHRSDIS